MKIKQYLLESVVAVAIVGFAAFSLLSPAVAQDRQYREDVGTLRVQDGNPNTLGKYGDPGDVYVDKATGSAYVKMGASGTNGWVPNFPISTETNSPVAGSLVRTGTSVKVYLSSTNGIEVLTGTNAAFTD